MAAVLWVSCLAAERGGPDMNINLMRLIDKWAGIPLCWIFTRVNRISPGRGGSGRSGPTPLRRIALLKLSETGSLILAADLVNRLRNKFPAAELSVVTFEQNREVLALLDYVPRERVFTLRNRSLFLFIAATESPPPIKL